MEKFGKIDILCNNVGGVGGFRKLVVDINETTGIES